MSCGINQKIEKMYIRRITSFVIMVDIGIGNIEWMTNNGSIISVSEEWAVQLSQPWLKHSKIS